MQGALGLLLALALALAARAGAEAEGDGCGDEVGLIHVVRAQTEFERGTAERARVAEQMRGASDLLRRECRAMATIRECNVTKRLLEIFIRNAHLPTSNNSRQDGDADDPAEVAPSHQLATWLFGLKTDGSSDLGGVQMQKDEEGMITRKEATRAFHKMGVSDEVASAMFEIMDSDSDHAVSTADIATVLRSAVLIKGLVPELERHHHRGRNASSMQSVELRPGIREKLAAARSRLQAKCDKQASEGECGQSRELVDVLIRLAKETRQPRVLRRINVSAAQRDFQEMLLERTASLAVNLDFWLYKERPFDALDTNNDDVVSRDEAMAGFKQVSDWEVAKETFPIMDRNGDDRVTRYEAMAFLRAAAFVRDMVPQLDTINPKDPLEVALYKAHTATARQEVVKKLTGGAKLLFLVVAPVIFYGVTRVVCYVGGSTTKAIVG